MRYLRARPPVPGALVADFAAIRASLGIEPTFPEAIEDAAAKAVRRGMRPSPRTDRTDLPFVTIDPKGSRDLDQALHIVEHGDGLRVHYAIADVAAYVDRGGPIEAEAWRRGVTAYAPDQRAPVYPASLTDGAVSLLPDDDRPSVLFTADLDARGAISGFAVERAIVRSRRRLSYPEAAAEGMPLLARLGALREALAVARGATRLDVPAQEVVPDSRNRCGFALRWEDRLPIEDWNAHVSLLVGMGAATMLLNAEVGLLRVMEPPEPAKLAIARAGVRALGVDWADGEPVGRLLGRIGSDTPRDAAALVLVRRAMGRASYVAFDGTIPAVHDHAAIAGPYAHVTAPLRRLADRYVLDLLVTIAAGAQPTTEDRATLLNLPAAMERAESRAGHLERELIDVTEARTLEHRVGERFQALVLGADSSGVRIQIMRPPVVARLTGADLPSPGVVTTVRLDAVDARNRTLTFSAAAPRNR